MKIRYGSFIMRAKQHRGISQRGFTLPEMLVVICITSMLLSFFLQCFFTVSEQHKQRSAMLELQDNLSLAIELLTRDIARSTSVLDCHAQQLTLQQENIISYSLGTDRQAQEHLYALEGKILYRQESTQGNRQPMANFIDTITFQYLDQRGFPVKDADLVQAVYVKISGQWQGKTIQQEQIVRLAGTAYL